MANVAEQPKLSKAAPTLPPQQEEYGEITYGVKSPVSAATIPSVYNKKLGNMFRGRLVSFPGDFTVGSALTKMARFNISSVPITKSKEDSTILGFVDMLDLLAFFCKLIGKEQGGELKIGAEELSGKLDQFRNCKLSEIVGLSGRNPFRMMHQDESLAEAVDQYLKGVHRIAISDDTGEIIGVISQWTIANYLATVPTDDKEWIPSLRAPVAQSQFKTTEVKCVNKNETALNAFTFMHSNKLSAVGVIDDEGKLCGNLSASDLKGFHLFLNEFSDLLQPVGQFLALIRKKQGRPENFVVAVPSSTPVKDIVILFNEEIIHRVYIVDNQYKPTAVFSLTNLLQGLVVDTHSIGTWPGPGQQQTAL